MTVRTIEHKLGRLARDIERINREANDKLHQRHSYRIPTGDPALRILDKLAVRRNKFCRLLERHPDRRIWVDDVFYQYIRPGEYRMVHAAYARTG